jgi:hypothetical protein
MHWPTTLWRCRVGILFGLLTASGASSFAADDATNEEREARMKRDITFLASPECEGRGPGTQGIDKAADYIAENFKKAGLKPGAGKGNYFQPFSFGGQVQLGSPNTLKLRGPQGQEIDLKMGGQFEVMGSSGSGTASAPIVFAGYGITATDPEINYDDFKGVDVSGKVVMVLRRTPRWDSAAAPFGGRKKEQLGTLDVKVMNAVKNKAAAVILVNDYTEPGDQLMPFRTLTMSFGGGGSVATIPFVQIRRDVADELIRSGLGTSLRDLERDIARDLEPRSRELKGWTASVSTKVNRDSFHVKNVIGVLEGSGPLANETVVVGAHYDHLGYGPYGSLSRDAYKAGVKLMHPGADDNGSGTTSVMELARRFGALKDRKGRRLVFMTFSGEERGLLGSRHYCFKEPIFPLDDTVAMVNLDMVGRLPYDPETKKGKLIVEGLGTGKGFEQLVEKLNEKHGFQLIKKQSGLGPSDHDSFCRRNIPVFFLWNNIHPDYHRPSDTADKINVKGMRQIADLAEEIIDHLSKTEKRPEFVQVKQQPMKAPVRGKVTLGIVPDYSSEGDEGLRVEDVTAGRPAAKAGLKAGDIIVEIAGQKIANIGNYTAVMAAQSAGRTIEVVVLRNKKRMTFKVSLE